MSDAQPAGLPSVVFDDNEPAIQTHPRVSEIGGPVFGDRAIWDFNGVVGRPANKCPGNWRINFTGVLEDPGWNLLARELSMILLNPRHPAVTSRGLSLRPRPAHPTTVIGQISRVRRLAAWADSHGLTAEFPTWAENDVRGFTTDLRDNPISRFGAHDRRVAEGRVSPHTVENYFVLLSLLYQLGPVLSRGGLVIDPCGGTSARAAAKVGPVMRLSTPAIAPDIWFPLLRASWAYVHTFSTDILRARDRHRALLETATTSRAGVEQRLHELLADRARPIPVHATTTHQSEAGQPHWSAIILLLGVRNGQRAGATIPDKRGLSNKRHRQMVLDAIASGHRTTTGLVSDLAQATRPDGTRGPWHPGLDAMAIQREKIVLRNACFILVVALSMMRDSEVHEITKGSLVEHYGYPAITSIKRKHSPHLPTKAWWIIEPAAEAITVAERLSTHHDRVFAPVVRERTSNTVHGALMIASFIAHVNATREWTGLDEIPDGRVLPHMFRRTMAMLTDQFAGSEIALGIQLKHVATRALANRTTQGYAGADVSWADHLDSAIDAARFRRLEDLYQDHKAGGLIGYGPGAERIAREFRHVQDSVKARGADATVERAMLRKASISLRFGTLNHCAFDEQNPAGAVCLENAIVPAGHQGPLQDRCRPDRCGNSVITPAHLPLWESERRALLTLIDTPGLASCRHDALRRELAEVDAVLDKTQHADNPVDDQEEP